MERIISKAKGLTHRPHLLLASTITLGLLFAAKQYFSGGTCKVKRDESGKVIVVTGGNTGIGKETVLELSFHDCTIIFGARDVKKSEDALKDILRKNPKANIIFYPLDLADLRSIDDFSARIKQKFDKVDILVNLAAVFKLPKRTLTNIGFEMHMGVNHLGHFYLTHKLWPIIKAAHKPRIINVSALAPIEDSNILTTKIFRSTLVTYICRMVIVLPCLLQVQDREYSFYHPAPKDDGLEQL